MICVTICDFGYDACRHALRRCEKYLHTYPDIMAEIRLDLCGLTEDETQRLFCDSKIPLIATCRRRSKALYITAILSGAAYADIDGIQPDSQITELLKRFEGHKVKKILSYQNFQSTPSLNELIKYFKNGISHGADVIKITTTAHDIEDTERLLSLYRLQQKGELDPNVSLVANSMGYAGSYTSVEAYSMGAPFLYCTLNDRNQLYPGMLSIDSYSKLRMNNVVSGEIMIPGSKNITQKAILAALLAHGESILKNFSTCRDSEAALALARKRGKKVSLKDGELIISGQGLKGKTTYQGASGGYLNTLKSMIAGSSSNINFEDTNFVGESGLLARLCIPLVAQVGHQVTVSGSGNLLERDMSGSKYALELFGASCVLTSEDTLPAIVNGPLIGNSVTLSAKEGSQSISGLILALPMSKKDSVLEVVDVTNPSNLLQTVAIVRNFGIELSYSIYPDKIIFNIPGRQKYLSSSMNLEGDWSVAANFIVAAAIYGSISLTGLDLKSSQPEKVILDIVRMIGADVKSSRKSVQIRRGHLMHFDFDVTNTPDLFPILVVLAAYCEGTSVISGLDRIRYRQNMRIETVCSSLQKMGVQLSLSDTEVKINGVCITRRILSNMLLRGGEYPSNGDHRVAMALKIASIHSQDKVSVDDMDCVNKSYPLFKDTLNFITKSK